MRKLLFFLLSLLTLFCFTSCELFYPEPETGVMRILVYGDTYDSSAETSVATRILEADGTERAYLLSPSGNQIPPAANDAVQIGNALVSHAAKNGIAFEITYMIGANVPNYAELELSITQLEDEHILKIGDDAGDNCKIINALDVDSVLEEIQLLSQNAKEEDLFIFYYSGHGVRGDLFSTLGDDSMKDYGAELKNDAYFWMLDGDSYAIDGSLKPGATVTRGSTLVNFKYLYQQIDSIKGKKLFILDNCYAGCMVEVDGFSVDTHLYKDKDMFDLFSPSGVKRSNSTFVLASSEYYNTSSFYVSPVNSDFTYSLLKGLGWNVEKNRLEAKSPAKEFGHITLHSLASYLHDNYDYLSTYYSVSGRVSFSGGSQDLILF